MHNNTWLLLVLALSQIDSALNAFPYQYQRIIITKGNTIVKTIDLISDFHTPLHELVRKPSRKQQRYLTADEKTAFTTAERTLLITLRKLAEQKKPIELIWEEPAEEFQTPDVLNEPIWFNWLFYSQRLKDEFSVSKHTSVVYNNGDTYRNAGLNIDLPQLSPLSTDDTLLTDEMLDMPVKNYLLFIRELLDPHTSKAMHDLHAVKKYEFKEYYDKLSTLWNNCVEQTIKPFYAYITDIIDQEQDMTLREFRTIIRKENKEEELDDVIFKFMDNIADLELLIKLFASPYNHTIIDAGGKHCTNVKNFLVSQFGGQEIVNLGTTTGSAWSNVQGQGVDFSPVLIARTWVYLAEDPHKALKRFKSRKRPLINLVNDDIWKEFIMVRDTLAALPPAYYERFDEDRTIKKQLLALYAKSSKTFIDFINVRDELRKTLLYYAVEKNLLKTTQFLLQHNARVNIQDVFGNTPLHYAAMRSMPEIITMLLEYGATTDIKNFEQKTSIEVAKEHGNDFFISTLEEYTKQKSKE